MPFDFDGLVGSVADAVKASLRGVLDGAERDLQTFGIAIANDLVAAARSGEAALVDECVHQAKTLAEVQRLRAVREAWETVEAVVRATGKTLLAVLSTAAGGVV